MRFVAAERRAKPTELRGTKPREMAIPPKDSKESKRTRCKAGFRALLPTVSLLFLSFSRVLDQNLPRLLFPPFTRFAAWRKIESFDGKTSVMKRGTVWTSGTEIIWR